MKSHIIVGPTLWVLLSTLLILSFVDGAFALRTRRLNITAVERKDRLTPAESIGIPRRLPAPWSNKLPAFRGRPRTTKPPATTPPDPRPDDLSPDDLSPDTLPDNATQIALKDDFEISKRAGDLTPRSVVWPNRARPPKRFRVTSTTPAPQLLLKLLQPKPTRPAIYSLDGFVPKPSIRVLVSTEPPPHFGKDLQLLGSSPKRRKANRYSKVSDEEDEDEYEAKRRRKGKRPVSRWTAFARKGTPGEDFPVLTFIPQTDFDCGPQPGLYADPFTDCQVWHMCPGGHLSPRHSFLCPNGTIFNQKKRICDWWYNVDCRKRKIRSLYMLPTELDVDAISE